MAQTFKSESRLHLGSSYYPEHWPADRWPEDIRLMQEAGFSVARLGEFAWSSMEPSQGDLQLDWLEDAIDQLAAAGIETVLGTPTAAPPTWLVSQHPDLLAVEPSGLRVQVGNRCHYCVTSPEFHAATQRIVAAMGERFGPHPHVIGWQFDNEYHRVCYCDRCRAHFQDFLQERYGTLEALNHRWSTAYWSQTYSDWAQIPVPIGPHNPGLLLEFQHFTTENYRRFQRLQVEALKSHLPEGVWMTHNFMKWFRGYDHYIMSQDLDMASWDWYVGMGHNDYTESGVLHDLVRGFKRKNFWLIETQPGTINWKAVNNALDVGEARAMAWHAVGHGADAVLYWQWRSALGGQEQMHGTLVDQSGRPRPFYQEARQLGTDFAMASSLLAGSQVVADVAMLNDYDSLWSIQWQPHHRDFDYVAHFKDYYRPLVEKNVAVDVVSARGLRDGDDLAGYKLVIAPALLVQTPVQVAALEAYVRRGGHLVLTVRCGMKDEYNALLPQRQPGGLTEMAGVEVEEYYALLDPVPVIGNWFKGQSRLWAERLVQVGDQKASVIARYGPSRSWLSERIAITVHPYGKGLVYYVGAYLDEDAQKSLLARALKTAAVTAMTTPPGIEICQRRRADGTRVYIVINHTPEKRVIRMPWPFFDHLSQAEFPAEVEMVPYGVAVMTQVEA